MLYELFILLAGAFLCHGYAGFLVPIYWNGVEMIFKALFIGEIYPTSNEMWDTQSRWFPHPQQNPACPWQAAAVHFPHLITYMWPW